MAIQAMDGRQRGKILKGADGKFASYTKWQADLQTKINEYYSELNRYAKYTDQNPDLKVYVNEYKSKIEDLEKEKRLVDFSNRGISHKLEVYRKSLEASGLKGKQLEDQIEKYKKELLIERRNYFDNLKGKNNARLIPHATPIEPPIEQPVKKQGFFSKVGNFFKGMFKGPKAARNSKIALAAAVVTAGAYGLHKLFGESSTKKDEVTMPAATMSAGTVKPKATPAPAVVAEVRQTEEPDYMQLNSGGLSWENIVKTYYPGLVEKHNGVLYGKDGAIRELKEELQKCGSGMDLVKSTDIPKILNLPLEIGGTAINKNAVVVRAKFDKTQTGGHTDIKEAGCKTTKTVYTVTDKTNNIQYQNTDFDTAVDSLKHKSGVKDYSFVRVS